MSSRRKRLLQYPQYNDTSPSEDSADPLQRPSRHLLQSDTNDSELRVRKNRAIVHPALTNYGPESLQCFLRDELDKLKSKTLEDQRKRIVEYAKFLVNNPDYLQAEDDELNHRLTIAPGRALESCDEVLDKTKGKTPLRNLSRQNALVNLTERDNETAKDLPISSLRPDVPPFVPHETSPYRNMRRPTTPPDTRSCSTETGPVSTPSTCTWPAPLPLSAQHPSISGNALNKIGLDENPKHRTGKSVQYCQASKRQNVQQKRKGAEDARDTHDGASVRTGAASNGEHSYFTLTQTQRNAPLPGQLIRAASFQNHADYTREIGRIRDNASPPSSDQITDDGRRRRKTPTNSQNRPTGMMKPDPQSQIFRNDSGSFQSSAVIDENAQDMDLAPSIVYVNATSSSDKAKRRSTTTVQLHSVPQAVTPMDTTMADLHDEEEDDLATASFQPSIDEEFAEWEGQRAILASYDGPSTTDEQTNPAGEHDGCLHTEFDYNQITPDGLPHSIQHAVKHHQEFWTAHGHGDHGQSEQASCQSDPLTASQLDPQEDTILNATSECGNSNWPRVQLSSRRRPCEPPFCPPPSQVQHSLPHEIWEAGVLIYLSSQEVRTLRLVCKSIAEDLELYVFRSVVTNFGPSFYTLDKTADGPKNAESAEPLAMLEKFGPGINKFGITFEYDQLGMTNAPFKTTETNVDTWFGTYKWPVKDYPYFPPLKEIDALLDNQPRLLIQAMKNLTSCHELALSVDSGHGWLNGPDMSDLALYRERAYGGTKVFGKTFPALDKVSHDGLRELFEWAQRNTINDNVRYQKRVRSGCQGEVARLNDIEIRDYESYRVQDQQPDFEKDLHTGKLFALTDVQLNDPPAFNNAYPLPGAQPFNINQPQVGPPILPDLSGRHISARRQRIINMTQSAAHHPVVLDSTEKASGSVRKAIQPQWPIVYNGYNIAADVGGDLIGIQERLASPFEHPLAPGHLTEAQAQWLMETSWVQRSFLSSYTDAIQSNALVFKNVHSLHVSKISSGMLSSLTQKSFWSSLPRLRALKILVKPDWRVEHVPGDKGYRQSMATKLIESTVKFAHLLKDTIARIESVNDLHIGYCSGGEHQAGIYARNQHILPAPVVTNPRDWLLAQNPANGRADHNTMFVFPHVRNLKFENCWFSPIMLETLMQKSQDSSLHNLILDSVSLTSTVHSTRTDGPLRTFDQQLKCLHPEGAWLQEITPANAGWVHVLDKITPGRTILDQKYEANMINEEDNPRPEEQFRGRVQSITLKSCGYVKIQGVTSTEFNQNDLVFHANTWSSFDDGLKARTLKFTKTVYLDPSGTGGDTTVTSDGTANNDAARRTLTATQWASALAALGVTRAEDLRHEPPMKSTQFIMQGGQTAHELLKGSHHNLVSGSDLTGYLTQCIHPIEKRILEQNWGMTFGWGDNMMRWDSVDDGWFIGGTGRFSGTVYKDSKMQDEANTARAREMANKEESRSDDDDTGATTVAADFPTASARTTTINGNQQSTNTNQQGVPQPSSTRRGLPFVWSSTHNAFIAGTSQLQAQPLPQTPQQTRTAMTARLPPPRPIWYIDPNGDNTTAGASSQPNLQGPQQQYTQQQTQTESATDISRDVNDMFDISYPPGGFHDGDIVFVDGEEGDEARSAVQGATEVEGDDGTVGGDDDGGRDQV